MIDIQKQEKLRQFVENEVFVCQTSLVEEALKNGIFFHDDIINFSRQFATDSSTKDICSSCNILFAEVDNETQLCRTCYAKSPEPQEIYEWWVVSDWLELQLKLAGEPILSNDYGSWWGRCTTGQTIFLDGVIEAIYNGLEK